MRNLTDQLDYARRDEVNQLRFMKKLKDIDREPGMKLVEALSEDVTILEAYGRLDSTTAKEFGDRLTALIESGRGAIVVDLQNVVYISSAGFRALLIANRATTGKARQARALRSDRRGQAPVRDRCLPGQFRSARAGRGYRQAAAVTA